MLKHYPIYNILLVFILFWQSAVVQALDWESLNPGLEYVSISPIVGGILSGELHAFRVDLQHFQLKLVYTQSFFSFPSTIEELVLKNHAVLGINGGFFTEELKPLGLRINEGKLLNPLKPISWWGIFYIEGQTAFIKSLKDFQYHKNIDFAIQAGPRLVVDGLIPHLKPGIAKRTAIGITQNGKIILVITNNLSLSTTDLGHILRDQLECVSALNLDGGNSTRLFAAIHSFRLHILGIAPVSDVILLVPY